jgi:hypothetical protein
MHLDAERAADVLGDDADLVFFKREMLGEQVLCHVWRLRALINGEALLARIPVGDHGARLVGDPGMAAEHEGRFDHGIRLGEAAVRIAGIERPLKGEIVAKLGMNHRRLGIERGFRIGHRGEHLIVDLDQRAGVLGLRAALRHHGAHRFALPAGPLDRDGVLRRRFYAFEMRKHADPRRNDFGKFGAGDYGYYARSFACRRRSELRDPRMRVRRTQKRDVRHARQYDVGDILAAPGRQPRQIRPRHRAADIGVRPIERGEAGRLVFGDFHGARLDCRSFPRKRGDERDAGLQKPRRPHQRAPHMRGR